METVDLKLVLLGQPGVGKTCLVYRYLYNTFGETISVRTPLLLPALACLCCCACAHTTSMCMYTVDDTRGSRPLLLTAHRLRC